MSTPEGKATQVVRLRAATWGSKVFRNNSGVLPNPHGGRPIRFGLGNESKKLNEVLKSPDLVGIHPVEITPDMVGKTIGVFYSIEVKPEGFVHKDKYPEGSRLEAQQRWHTMIIDNGGISGFASSAVDVDNLISEFNKRFRNDKK